jgi:hypothetical protein
MSGNKMKYNYMTEDARYKYNFIALAPKTVIACMNLEPFI